jgi:hypothetical protein
MTMRATNERIKAYSTSPCPFTRLTNFLSTQTFFHTDAKIRPCNL